MRILTIITPQTLENRAALRTAIAAVCAVLIAFSLHLDKPYWSGMTVVVLANVYAGNIIDKAILRIVGTVIGAWFGFFLASMIANSFFLYLLTNLILVTVAVYYYNFSSYAYAYLLGALAAFIVIAQLAINPDDVFYVAIWRPIEIGLGVLISAAAAFCLFPNNIHDNLVKEVDLIFDAVSSLLEQLKNSLLTGKPALAEIKESNVNLKKKLKKSIGLIGFMRRELGVKRKRIDQLRILFDLFYSLTRRVTYFIATSEKQGKHGNISEISQAVNDVFMAIQHDLPILKNAFFERKLTDPQLQTKSAMDALYQSIESQSKDPTEKIKSYFEMFPLLQQINTMITHLGDLLITQQGFVRSESKLISSQQQLSNDPDVIKHSIKAGLAAVLALCFWLVSNWPGGLNGIISSIVISIRKNLFEMKNISLHRILGCLSGGGLALFPLAFFALNLYDLILILFFAIWGFSYFSFKYTKYAYIGLQANIALVISLAQAGGPPDDLVPPLERLGGIFIGIGASFLVANILWRTDPLRLLSRNIDKLFRYLVRNLKELLLSNQGNLCDLTNLFWLTRDLLESFVEEQLSAKKREKLIEAKKRFTQLIIIQATLSNIYESIDIEMVHKAAAGLGIELLTLERSVVALYKTEKQEKINRLMQKIEGILENIDLGSYYATTPSDEIINCIAYLNALKQLTLLRTPM